MAVKKRRVVRRKAAKKKTAKRRIVRRKKVVHKSAPRKRSGSTIASLKSKIKGKLEGQLKELLFRRDKAATAKSHRSAQKGIDKVRAELRRIS